MSTRVLVCLIVTYFETTQSATNRDNQVGDVSMLGEVLQPLDRVLVADDVVQQHRPVLLHPNKLNN